MASMPVEWKQTFVSNGDIKIAVNVVGEGPKLLLIHGITASHRAFNFLARHLSKEYTLLAIDLRGRGDSSKPDKGNYGINKHASDVISVFNHYGLTTAPIVGHSMGAYVAVQVARDYPSRVTKLILIDGAHPAFESEIEFSESTKLGLSRAFNRLTMTFEGLDGYLKYWFPTKNKGDLHPDLIDYYSYDLLPVVEEPGKFKSKVSSIAATEDSAWIVAKRCNEDELKRLAWVNTMVACAKYGFFEKADPLIDEAHASAMKKALKPKMWLEFGDANHYSIVHEPTASVLAAAINEFVKLY